MANSLFIRWFLDLRRTCLHQDRFRNEGRSLLPQGALQVGIANALAAGRGIVFASNLGPVTSQSGSGQGPSGGSGNVPAGVSSLFWSKQKSTRSEEKSFRTSAGTLRFLRTSAACDIGMDVHGEEPPVIGGQVILSSPGNPCMRCLGFLTDEKLAEEAARYGKAGSRPQVVWPNGVLASTGVCLAVDIVTNWTRRVLPYAYLVYDGNQGTVKESVTLRNLKISACCHFSDSDVGDPLLVEL